MLLQVGGSHGEKLPKGSSPRSKFNVFLQAPGLSLALSTASSSKSPCASSRPGGGAPREAQGGDNPEISGTPHFPPDCLSTEPRQSFRGPNRGRKELFSPLAGEQEPHQGGGAYVAREVQTAIMAHQTVCQPVAVVAEDEAREENMDGGDAAFLLSKASEPDVPPTQVRAPGFRVHAAVNPSQRIIYSESPLR